MTKPVTIEVEEEALAAARAANLDLSELLTTALRRRLFTLPAAERDKAAREWYEANKEAVDSYNRLIEESGLFSDGIRMF